MDTALNFLTRLPVIPVALGMIFFFYWVNAFFIVYHLVRFGIGIRPKILSLVFLLGSVSLTMVVFILYGYVDLAAIAENIKQILSSRI